MADAPNPLLDRMKQILSIAQGALETDAPGRVHLMPGASPVWDDCCEEGGQVWVRVINIVPMAGKVPTCPVLGWRATLGVGTIRCAHVLDDDGNPPTPEEMTQDTERMTQDLANLGRALLCEAGISSVVNWLPAGPDGGCVGGEWTVTITYDWCGCG